MTHFFERSVLILLASTALAACVSPYEPQQIEAGLPVAPPAAPAPVIITPPPVAPAPPPAAVESRPLDVLPLPPVAAPAPRPTPPPPRRMEAPRPEPVYRNVTTRSVTGRVVEVEGPAVSYTVKKGDSLERIAKKLDTDIERLAKDNKLKKPYRIHPGDDLKGPRQPAKAYVVGQGDTLFSIAKRFSVSVEALRGANDLGRGASISSGRRLRLPSGYRDKGPIVTTSRVEVARVQAARVEAEDRTALWPAPVEEAADPPAERAVSPPVPEEPRSRTVTNRSVTGRVVEIETPGRTAKVRKGDSLEKIARELDSDVAELAKLNKLKKPYRLQPGQTIRGPGGSAKAYVVGSGDTLSAIAKRFDVSVDALRNANGLRRGASVGPGRRLRLPSGYRDRGPIVTTSEVPPPPIRTTPTPPPPARAQPPVATPYRPLPYNPPRRVTPPRTYTPQGGVRGAPSASPALSDSQIMEMGAGRFAWPLQGDIISGFGGRGTGPRNDGLNIRASAGTPVRAAAGGDVVYAGDQVPGFGNLVLIKHPDGWVTAYGHLSRIGVRMQQKVSQGQTIGETGSSGGVSEPQLHFEVRHAPTPQERARPVDPALVLPR